MHLPNLRDGLASLLLWLTFMLACAFYGVGANLIMLLAASACLLLALATLGPRRLLARFAGSSGRRDPRLWVCLWVLVVLAASYQFVSISPESSLGVSWVLASLPLWFLAYSSLSNRAWLRAGLLVTVSCFALVSALRFLFDGQKAYEPLADPNNYASLLYLAWIPLTHQLLLAGWGRPALARWQMVCGYALCGLLALVIFATSSRVGSLILLAALAGCSLPGASG